MTKPMTRCYSLNLISTQHCPRHLSTSSQPLQNKYLNINIISTNLSTDGLFHFHDISGLVIADLPAGKMSLANVLMYTLLSALNSTAICYFNADTLFNTFQM
ncbi:hypothetical protein BDZ94DRAFT_1268723 [Collybia nuda]|uniref:Uncharacterized protein n=1 Tax=Collybia nuda TaxID=64659 RepID=A0A9P5XYT7_9AGAR|nr:hypothetical protein BDZ94DRAFT_1268723 [Collybia nuda]